MWGSQRDRQGCNVERTVIALRQAVMIPLSGRYHEDLFVRSKDTLSMCLVYRVRCSPPKIPRKDGVDCDGCGDAVIVGRVSNQERVLASARVGQSQAKVSQKEKAPTLSRRPRYR